VSFVLGDDGTVQTVVVEPAGVFRPVTENDERGRL
jgi:hypothetical protein